MKHKFHKIILLLGLTHLMFSIPFNFLSIFNAGCDPLLGFPSSGGPNRLLLQIHLYLSLSNFSNCASFSFRRVLEPSCLNAFVCAGPSTMNSQHFLYS